MSEHFKKISWPHEKWLKNAVKGPSRPVYVAAGFHLKKGSAFMHTKILPHALCAHHRLMCALLCTPRMCTTIFAHQNMWLSALLCTPRFLVCTIMHTINYWCASQCTPFRSACGKIFLYFRKFGVHTDFDCMFLFEKN